MKIKQKIQKKSLRTLENDENTIIKNYTQKKIGKRWKQTKIYKNYWKIMKNTTTTTLIETNTEGATYLRLRCGRWVSLAASSWPDTCTFPGRWWWRCWSPVTTRRPPAPAAARCGGSLWWPRCPPSAPPARSCRSASTPPDGEAEGVGLLYMANEGENMKEGRVSRKEWQWWPDCLSNVAANKPWKEGWLNE